MFCCNSKGKARAKTDGKHSLSEHLGPKNRAPQDEEEEETEKEEDREGDGERKEDEEEVQKGFLLPICQKYYHMWGASVE